MRFQIVHLFISIQAGGPCLFYAMTHTRVPAQAHVCTYVLHRKGCIEPGWEGDAQLPGLGLVGIGKHLLVNHLGFCGYRRCVH